MNDNIALILLIFAWIAGFFSAWMYSVLKIRYLREAVTNLQAALDMANNTIIDQGNEIHGILIHAQRCESELIN